MMRVPGATLGLLLVARTAVAQVLPFGAMGGEPAARAGPLVEVTLRLDRAVSGEFEVLQFVPTGANPAWRLERTSAVVAGPGHLLVVAGTAGSERLIVLRRPGSGAYVLDGPLRWPSAPETRVVPTEWRRTIAGRLPGEHEVVQWIDGQTEGQKTRWPACDWTGRETWECLGVPLSGGIVLIPRRPGLAFGIVPEGVMGSRSGAETVPIERAAWGRLVVVSMPAAPGDQRPESVRASARRLAATRTRAQSTRIETETEPRVQIRRVGERSFWVSAQDEGADGWIEFGAQGWAPARIVVQELVSGSAELPVTVSLANGSSVSGRVVSTDGAPAAGAVVSLYRLAEAAARGQPPLRIAVGEARAAENGEFAFHDLGQERYQILAVHPSLGRGERPVDADGHDIEVRLRPPAQIVGRIVRQGKPASGVPVAVVPDIAQFATSVDVTELRGGEGRSQGDGRFRLAAGWKGAAELRVGDERTGIRRIPLPPAESLPPTVDVGVVELADLAPATLVLEGAEGCDVLLTGPAGRLGLTTTRARRLGPAMFEASVPEPGAWHVVAICGPLERAVLPAMVQFSPGGLPQSIRLTWPFGSP